MKKDQQIMQTTFRLSVATIIALGLSTLTGCTEDPPPKAVCGNSAVESPETCDGTALNGKSCTTEGFAGGTLSCQATCDGFVTSACTTCGDNVKNGSDTCDGTDVGTATCTGLGYDSGTLGCASTCAELDAAGCVLNGDSCDNTLTINEVSGTQTITGDTTLGTSAVNVADTTPGCPYGSAGADLIYTLTLTADAGVSVSVSGYDTVAVILSGACSSTTVEACNDDDAGVGALGSKATANVLAAGTYYVVVDSYSDGGAFSMDVVIQPGGFPRCGDATVQANRLEVCDTANLDGADCASLGLTGGTLACAADCLTFDTTACTSTATCANNLIEGNEVCDGTALATRTCANFGFLDGTLACNATCDGWDLSGCNVSANCGDALHQGFEACDGASWGGDGTAPACDPAGTTTMGCKANCTPDLSPCTAITDVCQAAGWYDDGVCDACNLNGGTIDYNDCVTACGANGACADTFDAYSGAYTCQQLGLTDPDCTAACGNSTREDHEICDGTLFANNDAGAVIACTDFNYTGGTLACVGCKLDFSGCTTN